ncbi:NADPH:quinone reductase [Actinoplanes sp. N902-109]|uniref:NADPH:quinone reductase n=1 Tax=Actinoplanes sp. (strain N902-109) TaxID=649831 RepID=UPI00059F991C|nr:NADPH:quinone reductase [Actinoplanes sp. N902-109]
MLAAWYDIQGPPAEVLRYGRLPAAEPGPGEVRVRLRTSGVNPGDVKKRQAWLGSSMAFPRIVPHSDGAGTIDAVGDGVDPGRIGSRVWVFGAQSYRPFGTAAQSTVVPSALAVDAAPAVSDEVGACLGIPGITAHRAVFADGPVDGSVVLVHGVRGAVGSMAAQLARWRGATVIGTVRTGAEIDAVKPGMADHVVALDDGPAAAIRDLAPDGVDRVVEVAFSANMQLDLDVCRVGAVIAAYASPAASPALPFWPMLFNNLVIRLLGSDDFPLPAKVAAGADLTRAVADGALTVDIAASYALDEVARAHDAVEGGRAGGRVVLTIPQ